MLLCIENLNNLPNIHAEYNVIIVDKWINTTQPTILPQHSRNKTSEGFLGFFSDNKNDDTTY